MSDLKIHFECKSVLLSCICISSQLPFYLAGVIVIVNWNSSCIYVCICALIAGQQNQYLHHSLRSAVWQEKNPKSPPSRPAESCCLSACNLHTLTPLCGGPSSPLPADVLPAFLESSRTHPSTSWEWQWGFKKVCLVG